MSIHTCSVEVDIMRKIIMLLVVVFLALVTFSRSASVEMVDVFHLKNGSIIKGMLTEIKSDGKYGFIDKTDKVVLPLL